MRRLLLVIGLLAVVLIIVAEVARGAEPGRVNYRVDAKSYADSIPAEWFATHVQRALAYPPTGDRYPAAGLGTLAYHDAWTTWGSQGATHISEYVAWVKRDREHGYLGQFMDDVNFAGGNIAGTRAQYANLIEAVRQALGPEGVLEINAQFADIWPLMQARHPDVARALSFVNVVDKEFGVASSAAGITTPARYAEYLAYVEALHAKGIATDIRSAASGDEYSLATYFLVSWGGDWIGKDASPSNWWSGFEVNLGGPAYRWSNGTPARFWRERSGMYGRAFKHGLAFVNPPGNPTATRSLFGTWHRISGEAVSSITLGGGQGVVLLAG